ncbi:MAG: 2-C-methyl-D-erythritol 2,4-cyclodiphosphate synthase [Lentimicrobiaceae bacterium]|nr:2-C-methyl-D-erythritol 2,4-cyclodiphosphate synthase [Lentimicrobiaceae bacterium]
MSDFRIGIGYDVHQLIKGRKLILGGVNIKYHKGLLGHSDADVLIHSIADALLGAAALGDLGKHFPAIDYNKGISGQELIFKVVDLITSSGFSIVNIDTTIILQNPAISIYVDHMRQNISKYLGIAIDKVSVKATTTDKLGFIGKEEGIAAQAIVMIK